MAVKKDTAAAETKETAKKAPAKKAAAKKDTEKKETAKKTTAKKTAAKKTSKVREAIDELKENVKAAVEDTKEGAAVIAEDTSAAFQDAKEQTKAVLEDMKNTIEEVKEGAKIVAEDVKEFVAEEKEKAAAAEEAPAVEAAPAAEEEAPAVEAAPAAEEAAPAAEEAAPAVEEASAPELPQPRRSVAFIGSECYPFVKTGGLGDVMYALPKALIAQNCDVRVILPRYACIKQQYQEKMVYRGAFQMDLCEDGKSYYVGIMEYVWDGVVYDFIDNEEFFSWGKPYTNLVDDIPKFCFFGKAALAALNYMDWIPDVIHCHDWQAGLVPIYLRTLFQDTPVNSRESMITDISSTGPVCRITSSTRTRSPRTGTTRTCSRAA